MKIKLVAFDWNGTLISDTSIACEAEVVVFKHFKLEPMSLNMFRKHWQIPIKEFFLAVGMNEQFYEKNFSQMHNIWMSHYGPREQRARTRSNAKSILKWLQDNGIKAVVFSNHPTAHIQKQCERLGISQYFYKIMGRDDHKSIMHKRSKDVMLTTLVKDLKLKPNTVVTVGDSVEEIEIARDNGYTSCAITDGYQSTKRLKASKPDYLINNLGELKEIIKSYG